MDEKLKQNLEIEETEVEKNEIEETEEKVIEEEVIEEKVEEQPKEQTKVKDITTFIETAEKDAPPKELKPMEIQPVERGPVGILIGDVKKSKSTIKETPKKDIDYQNDESEKVIEFVALGASVNPDADRDKAVEEWTQEEQNFEFMPEEMFRPEIEQRIEKKQRANKTAKKKKKKKTKIVLAIVIPIVVILLAFGAFAAVNVVKAKNEVSTLKDNAENFLNAMQTKDTPKSEKAYKKLCDSTQKIDEMLDGPFFKIIGVIPRVKKELNVARELVDIVIDAEGNLLTPLIEKMKEYPLSTLKVGDGFNTKLMNAYLDFLEEKQSYLEEMLARIDSLDEGSLIGGYIGEKKAKITELVDSYHEAMNLLPLLRTIIGDGSDRLYILAAQNSAEIRASGGFPGSMGTIKIQDGILTIGNFKSVYDMLHYELADDSGIDVEDYQFGSAWLANPWDACFIPDFSKAGRVWATSYRDMRWEQRFEIREEEAQDAIRREEAKANALAEGKEYEEEIPDSDCVPAEYFDDYNYYMNKFHVDGVISMTPAIIQMMLEDVGEIELSDGTKLDSTNATRVLQHELYMKYFSEENYAFGSNYMADMMFAQTAKKAMKGFVGNFEVSKFSYYYKLFKNGIEKHIINIWMDNPEDQKVIEEAGAAGALSYDLEDPFTGIYVSSADPSKLGWYLDVIPEVGEPVDNPDGSKTYDVEVTLRNTLTYEEAGNLSWYIIGGYGGAIFCYVHFLAPAGGSISNIYTSDYSYMTYDTYHGLETFYNNGMLIEPQETITVNYQITTAPGVETPLRAVTTPTLTAYRE